MPSEHRLETQHLFRLVDLGSEPALILELGGQLATNSSVRRAAHSWRSSLMCAGGPPKPVQPIRPYSWRPRRIDAIRIAHDAGWS